MIFNRHEKQTSGTSWVRELVDPGGTLPDIKIIDDPKQRGKDKKLVQLNGENLGEVVIGRTGKTNYFEKVSLTTRERPKGCGLATYVCAIEEALRKGYSFGTASWYLTEDAVKIWKILAKTGVATVNREFEKVNEAPRFMGDYRVHPRPVINK